MAWLRRTFTREQMVDVLRPDLRLTPLSANFWALILGVPSHDVAALAATR